MTITSEVKIVILLATIMTLVVITNLWPDYHYAHDVWKQSDTASYRAIALAAPGIPAETVAYHHAQRFWLPWLLGIIAKSSGISLDIVFRLAACGLWVGVSLVFLQILRTIRLSLQWQAIFLVALLSNPYCGRYFLAVPFMVTDLLFILGFSIIICGVVRDAPKLAAIGMIVAAFGRQTALPIMVAIWLWQSWRSLRDKHCIWDIAVVVEASFVVIGLYMLGSGFAQKTGTQSYNIEHIKGLFCWFGSDAHNKKYVLAEFFLRGIVSAASGIMLLVVLIKSGRRPFPTEFWFIGLCVLAAWAQPLLGGPEITGQNIGRLWAGGTVGILAMGALLVRKGKNKLPHWVVTSICSLLVCGSFHHLLSWPGAILLQTPELYAVMALLVALTAGGGVWYGMEREGNVPSEKNKTSSS